MRWQTVKSSTNDTTTIRTAFRGTKLASLFSLKPGFHACVSRTHNGARCLTMYEHQCSQAIPTFATKACELATKSHMLNFCEGLRGLCRDMLWLWPMETNNAGHKKDFLSSEKKSKAKNKKYNDYFRKVVIFNQIPDALHDLHASKYKKPCKKPNDGCLRKPAKRNSVRASKQLWLVVIGETFML